MYRYFIIILIISILFYLCSEKTQEGFSIADVYLGDSFISVNNMGKWKEYNLTYGEITEDGIKNIIKYVTK